MIAARAVETSRGRPGLAFRIVSSSASVSAPLLNPPATSTIPLGNKVAVCRARAVLRFASSASRSCSPDIQFRARGTLPVSSNPPATSAIAVGQQIAVCSARAVLRLPVTVQVPLFGW